MVLPCFSIYYNISTMFLFIYLFLYDTMFFGDHKSIKKYHGIV